jgi:ribosome-interacting GTPase 1
MSMILVPGLLASPAAEIPVVDIGNVIKAAASGPLGIVALSVVALCVVILIFFRDSNDRTKVVVTALLGVQLRSRKEAMVCDSMPEPSSIRSGDGCPG